MVLVFSFNEYRKGRAFLTFISRCNSAGRFIMLSFNLTQCALNVAIIYLLSIGLLRCTGTSLHLVPKFNDDTHEHAFFLAEDNWEIMFGHYIFFLEHLQRCIFYSIAVIFSKWYRISFATDDNRILGLQAKSVLPIWLFTKYQYNHFTLEILLLICTSLIGPMTYFYQHLRPGTLAIYNRYCMHSTFGLICPN